MVPSYGNYGPEPSQPTRKWCSQRQRHPQAKPIPNPVSKSRALKPIHLNQVPKSSEASRGFHGEKNAMLLGVKESAEFYPHIAYKSYHYRCGSEPQQSKSTIANSRGSNVERSRSDDGVVGPRKAKAKVSLVTLNLQS